jgi:hypothetical protein
MSKDTEDAGGKLEDPGRANQPDVEDDRTRLLDEATGANDFGSREAGQARVAERGETQDVDQYHTGGGWYEMPDGSKVQGKEAAQEALAKQS